MACNVLVTKTKLGPTKLDCTPNKTCVADTPCTGCSGRSKRHDLIYQFFPSKKFSACVVDQDHDGPGL